MLAGLIRFFRGEDRLSVLQRRTLAMGLMPLERPAPPPEPPRGFRWGSEPPSLDCLVHLDNDHPYRNAGRGDPIERLESYVNRTVVDVGMIVGRMGSRDVRARHLGPHPHDPPEGYPGLYVNWEKAGLRWESCQNVFRQTDMQLTLVR